MADSKHPTYDKYAPEVRTAIDTYIGESYDKEKARGASHQDTREAYITNNREMIAHNNFELNLKENYNAARERGETRSLDELRAANTPLTLMLIASDIDRQREEVAAQKPPKAEAVNKSALDVPTHQQEIAANNFHGSKIDSSLAGHIVAQLAQEGATLIAHAGTRLGSMISGLTVSNATQGKAEPPQQVPQKTK